MTCIKWENITKTIIHHESNTSKYFSCCSTKLQTFHVLKFKGDAIIYVSCLWYDTNMFWSSQELPACVNEPHSDVRSAPTWRIVDAVHSLSTWLERWVPELYGDLRLLISPLWLFTCNLGRHKKYVPITATPLLRATNKTIPSSSSLLVHWHRKPDPIKKPSLKHLYVESIT